VRVSNGNFITSQGDAVNPDPNAPSELVEYSPNGVFVASLSIDNGPGSAFGIAFETRNNRDILAAVNDGTNALLVWSVRR
jgi:hypothetical protein